MKKLLLFTLLILSNLAVSQAPTKELVVYYGLENNINSHHNGLYNLTNLNTSEIPITCPKGEKIPKTMCKNIDISHLSKGIYILRIEYDKKNVTTEKLIVK